MNSKVPESAEELKELLTGYSKNDDHLLNIKNHYNTRNLKAFFSLRGTQPFKNKLIKKKTVALVEEQNNRVILWYRDAKIEFCYDGWGKLYDIYYSQRSIYKYVFESLRYSG